MVRRSTSTPAAQLSSCREQSEGLCLRRGGEGRRPQPKPFRPARHPAHPLREHNTPPATKMGSWNALGWIKTPRSSPAAEYSLHCTPSGISGQTLAEGREVFDRQQTQSRAEPSMGTAKINLVSCTRHIKTRLNLPQGFILPSKSSFHPSHALLTEDHSPRSCSGRGVEGNFQSETKDLAGSVCPA